jgi:hypothetical protein
VFNYFFGPSPFALIDQVIEVHRTTVKLARQFASYGSFPGAHKAHNDYLPVVHALQKNTAFQSAIADRLN